MFQVVSLKSQNNSTHFLCVFLVIVGLVCFSDHLQVYKITYKCVCQCLFLNHNLLLLPIYLPISFAFLIQKKPVNLGIAFSKTPIKIETHQTNNKHTARQMFLEFIDTVDVYFETIFSYKCIF